MLLQSIWMESLVRSELTISRGPTTGPYTTIKVCFKNFKIVAVTRTCIRSFSIRQCFKALTE